MMQIFPTRMCNVTAWRYSRLRAHLPMALVRGGGCSEGEVFISAFPIISAFPSGSYLSFVYGRSLWAELNGGENSLQWKENMLPLFCVSTSRYTGSYTVHWHTESCATSITFSLVFLFYFAQLLWLPLVFKLYCIIDTTRLY